MSSTDDTEAHLFDGTKEAAGWALRLLEQVSGGAMEPAEQLRQRLLACPPEYAVVVLLGLVNITGRFGVHSPDVAALKVMLRRVASGDDDDAVRGSISRPAAGEL